MLEIIFRLLKSIASREAMDWTRNSRLVQAGACFGGNYNR